MYTHTHTLRAYVRACVRVSVCTCVHMYEYTELLAADPWRHLDVWRGRIPQQDKGLVHDKVDVL